MPMPMAAPAGHGSTDSAGSATTPPCQWHVFLSYRVATEKRVAKSLWEKAQLPECTRALPHALRPRVFLDQKCLVTGAPWEEGFTTALSSSMVFVPLVSWHAAEGRDAARGSVASLVALRPGGKDWCDNVLFEWELALELLACEGAPLSCIMPVLVGDCDERGFRDYFDCGQDMAQLSSAPGGSPKTKERVVKAMEAMGHAPSAELATRSVREVVQQLLRLQGVKLEGPVEKELDACALALGQQVARALRVAAPGAQLQPEPKAQGEDEAGRAQRELELATALRIRGLLQGYSERRWIGERVRAWAQSTAAGAQGALLLLGELSNSLH